MALQQQIDNENAVADRDVSAVPHSSNLYSRLAPAYNALWTPVASRRMGEAIRSLDIPAGSEVLEVGVGTGISLRHYPSHCRVRGIDLSDSMLDEAKEQIQRKHWTHVEVESMNAESLEFEDNQFDIVTSFHTISVVSDPAKMMAEVVRVCRPGGRVLILNHFRSGNPFIAGVVDRANDLTKRFGWRTDLDSGKILEPLPLQIDSRYKTNPFSLFTIFECTCEKC